MHHYSEKAMNKASEIALQIHRVIVRVSLQKNGQGLSLLVSPLPIETGLKPTMQETNLLFRIFEKYAREGNPSVGRHWIICLDDPLSFRIPRMVAVVSLTNILGRKGILEQRRLMIWQANDVTKSTKCAGDIEINLNHISFESNGKGLKKHMTGTGKTDEKRALANGTSKKDGNDHVLGRFCISQFDDLDRLVSVQIPLNPKISEEKVQKDLTGLRVGIQAPRHLIVGIPEGQNWSDTSSVVVEFRLSDDNVIDNEWSIEIPKAIFPNTPNEHSGNPIKTKKSLIELEPGIFLKIGVIVVPARMTDHLIWVDSNTDI
jgi:hypothetical protein